MSIVQGVASGFVYRILNVITVFFINICLSRLAGAEGLGILSLVIATLAVYNLFTSLGLDAGITYNTAAKKIPREKIISVIIAIVALQIAAGFLIERTVYFFSGKQLFSYHQKNYLFVCILLLVSISLTEKFSALLQAQNLFKPVNAALFFSNLFTAIILGSMWLLNFHLPFIPVLEIFISLTFCQSVLLIIIYYSYFPYRFSFNFLKSTELKILFSYAIVTFIINTIQFMAYRIDYWLIEYFLKNETSLGLYAQAVKLSQLFWIIPLFFSSVIFPVVSRNKSSIGPERLAGILRVMNVVTLVGCIIAFLISDWLMPFLFGSQFAGSSYPFKLLLPGIFLFTNTTIIAAYFAGINKLKINLIGSVICLVTVLILDILFIPRYGIAGASVATTISYILTTVYFIAAFLRTTNSSFMNLFFFKRKDFILVCQWLTSDPSKSSAL